MYNYGIVYGLSSRQRIDDWSLRYSVRGILGGSKMTGLKERRRLALYVALGLSAGSGLTLDASTAYANVTITSTDTAQRNGNDRECERK